MNRHGITLIEILVAGVVMSVAMLVLFVVNSSSQRMTMDSYYEFLTMQIAQEPIEVFRAVGYPECKNLPAYPIDESSPISGSSGIYPLEATMFDRHITLKEIPPLCMVTVTVSPRARTHAESWMSKSNSVTVKGIIPIVQ
jgi:Tfp pilus assembly protein PilV